MLVVVAVSMAAAAATQIISTLLEDEVELDILPQLKCCSKCCIHVPHKYSNCDIVIINFVKNIVKFKITEVRDKNGADTTLRYLRDYTVCLKHDLCFRRIMQRSTDDRSFFADIIPQGNHPLRIETKQTIKKEPIIQNVHFKHNSNRVKSNTAGAKRTREHRKRPGV